jgi:PGF-CTERM protein
VRNALLVVALVVIVSAPVAASTASDRTAPEYRPTGDGPVRTTATTAAAEAPSTNDRGTDDAVILERVTVDRTPNRSGSVRVDVTYELPSSVVEFSADTEYLDLDTVTLSASPGFDQQRDDSFEWDGDTTEPTLSFRIDAPSRFSSSQFNVEADDWAFVSLPTVAVSWRYRGAEPVFRSESETANGGAASSGTALDGTANTSSRTIQGVNFTLVSSPDTTPAATVDEYASLYAVGLRELEGIEREELKTFLVSTDDVDTDALAAGAARGDSFWVQGQYAGIDYVRNTPAHEFVHTRMGSFGDESSRWLTEASAEYYGYVLTLNTARGTWSEFREALRVRDTQYREATLTDPSTWSEDTFQRTPYRKGALVLAALDAEIANRTGGVRSLQDVFAYRFDEDDQYGYLETYENFSAAVVAVTNDPSMRDWLDTYVAGSGVPSLPSDPDPFALNASMDSDDDGVANGDEIRTNPFQSDTDRDGIDDGDDAFPTDGTRYEETTTTTTSTTTAGTTTPTTTETTAATRASTTTETTAATRASTTTPRTTAGSGAGEDGDGTDGTAVQSAGATGTDATSASSGGDGGDGQDPSDTIPGFGVVIAAVALLTTAVALRRRD